ncbi:unnamed protein product [Echinostoma caproni]|uniref:Uncharacterized protein n=1 Tax=Echinostoma caproni TaxID=27848 RepID=A0A183B6Q8_9TREM|nr:unnamed protein product [Echinostoma caproni]
MPLNLAAENELQMMRPCCFFWLRAYGFIRRKSMSFVTSTIVKFELRRVNSAFIIGGGTAPHPTLWNYLM